jgi:hypothetical protein
MLHRLQFMRPRERRFVEKAIRIIGMGPVDESPREFRRRVARELEQMSNDEFWRVFRIALSDVVLVFEDWTPRLPLKSGERVVFYPVRIPAMFEGLAWRCLPPDGVRWQLPSTAMTFATDARLRSWGLWFRGRVHQRDAARHVAAQLNSLLG